MAGKVGRPPKSGTVYRFDFYYRIKPGEDPPELEELLKAIITAKGAKRRDILRAALLGGAQQAQKVTSRTEDSEDISLLEEMFAEF